MGAKWFGASVKRKEDPAFLTGTGRFVDDIALPGMLYAAVVRSPHAHAMIRGIDMLGKVQDRRAARAVFRRRREEGHRRGPGEG